MLDSLERLAALPGDTRVCCGHEYTLSNAAFARVVDTDHLALMRRIEEAQAPPQSGRHNQRSPLATERATTPHLPSHVATVHDANAPRAGTQHDDPARADPH